MARMKAYSPTCLEMEVYVAKKFNIRQCLIIPNISWGFQIHEYDLLIVTKSGYATEVEIKVSLADLKKDAKKKHAHTSKKIKYLYFAIPEKLLPHIQYIPDHAGIFVLKRGKYSESETAIEYSYIEKYREAKKNPLSRALTPDEVKEVMRLGCMRIWGLKQKVLENQKNKKHENNQH